MKIITFLLNGPPRCGKDTIAAKLMEDLHTKYGSKYHIVKGKFATPIKVFVNTLVGANSWYEPDDKEQPGILISGQSLSWRQACIKFSEEAVKPVFGQGVFGHIAAVDGTMQAEMLTMAKDSRDLIIIMTDAGFTVECEVYHRTMKTRVHDRLGGQHDIRTVVVQISRDGCSFTGDSRSYVSPKGMPVFEVFNADNALYTTNNTMRRIVDYVLSKPERA